MFKYILLLLALFPLTFMYTMELELKPLKKKIKIQKLSECAFYKKYEQYEQSIKGKYPLYFTLKLGGTMCLALGSVLVVNSITNNDDDNETDGLDKTGLAIVTGGIGQIGTSLWLQYIQPYRNRREFYQKSNKHLQEPKTRKYWNETIRVPSETIAALINDVNSYLHGIDCVKPSWDEINNARDGLTTLLTTHKEFNIGDIGILVQAFKNSYSNNSCKFEYSIDNASNLIAHKLTMDDNLSFSGPLLDAWIKAYGTDEEGNIKLTFENSYNLINNEV